MHPKHHVPHAKVFYTKKMHTDSRSQQEARLSLCVKKKNTSYMYMHCLFASQAADTQPTPTML